MFFQGVLEQMPEQCDWLDTLAENQLDAAGGRQFVVQWLLRAALGSCYFSIENTPLDGIPYWDTGAPGLAQMGDYLQQPADPFNALEPVDSSAAAIGAQGLLRLGRYLQEQGETESAARYWQAGLTVAQRLFSEPYLSREANHQGLLLHTIYHRPRAWDHVPEGSQIPNGEAPTQRSRILEQISLIRKRSSRSIFHRHMPLLTFGYLSLIHI